MDTAGFERGIGAPPVDTLNSGNVNGKSWIPAECDVSIRPGWFYHPQEDSAVKSGRDLMKIYLTSVGRGSNLLLNVPPDRRGLISAVDSASLMAFRDMRECRVSGKTSPSVRDVQCINVPCAVTSLQCSPMVSASHIGRPIKHIDSCTIELEMDGEKEFNTILLQEYIEARPAH